MNHDIKPWELSPYSKATAKKLFKQAMAKRLPRKLKKRNGLYKRYQDAQFKKMCRAMGLHFKTAKRNYDRISASFACSIIKAYPGMDYLKGPGGVIGFSNY